LTRIEAIKFKNSTLAFNLLNKTIQENKMKATLFLINRLLTITFLLFNTIFVTAQEENTIFNDYNMQPEVWHFTGYPKGQVDNKGDLNLSVPILTIPGRGGLDFEVNFNYHAPIPKNQQATWIGLGWSFDPGSITRDPQAGVLPLGSIDGSGVDFAYVDTLQPDMYYLTIPGQGTLPMSRSNRPEFYDYFVTGSNLLGKQYVPLNASQFYLHSWKPWKIDIETDTSTAISFPPYTSIHPHKHGPSAVQEITRFQIITDDGTRYVFAMPSLANYKTSYYGSGPDNEDHYISAWRLIAILSPECPDTVTVPNENTSGNWVKFEYRFKPDTLYKYIYTSGGKMVLNTYLWKITTPTHYAEFETAFRHDGDMELEEEGAHRKLTAIHLFRNGNADTLKSVYLHQSQSLCENINSNIGKTTLDSIAFKGRHRAKEPGYKFKYVDYNPDWYDLKGKDDDDFGYYDDGGWSTDFDDNVDDAKAWSLETIYYPSGGSETYEYENDELFANFANREEISIAYLRFVRDEYNEEYDKYTEYYDFKDEDSDRFRQGGTRVTRIIRKDANGNEIIESYLYGTGFTTGVPPGFFARYGEYAYYTPGNRGSFCVIYNYLEKISSTGTIEVRYYSIPYIETHSNPAPYLDSLQQISLMYIDQLDNGKTIVTGNEDILWGHNIKTTIQTIGHSIDTEKKYFNALAYDYQSISKAFSIPDHGNTVYVKWFNPYVDSVFSTENGLQKITTFEYDNGPRFPSKNIEIGNNNVERITETTYAFEIDDYGGDSSNVIGMRKANMLKQAAQTISYTDSSSTLKYYGSDATKWKGYITANEDTIWKPYRQYYWLKDGPQSTAPSFTAWSPASNPGSDWQLGKTFLDYDDYGQLILLKDANDDTTELFYGDNTTNFSNSSDSLAHTYLTGVRKSNLDLAYDYDRQTGQVTSMADPNDQVVTYYYDYMGRYAGVVNPEGLVTSEFAYYISGDTSGSNRNYIETCIYPNGNLVRNSSFEVNGPDNILEAWDESGSTFAVLAEKDDAVLGNSYVKFNSSSNIETTHDLSLDAGREYIISAWMKKVSGNAQARITLLNLNGKFQYLNKSTSSSYGSSGNDVYLLKTISASAWERIWLKFRCTQSCTIQVRLSSQDNYLYSDDIILAPLLTRISDAVFPDDIEPRVQIDYYDGLVRKIQTVTCEGPYLEGNQVITHTDYDDEDRVKREWKPFPSQKSDANSAMTAFEPEATDSSSLGSRSAFDYYDGSTAPDGGDFPYSEYIYGIDDQFVQFTFFPGEEFHLPHGSDPYSYPLIHTSTASHYLAIKHGVNYASDGLNYPDSSLRKIITADENNNLRISFVDKFGQRIRDVSYEKGVGDVRMSAQAFADTIYETYDVEKLEITAMVDESIDVLWKATMSNLQGDAMLRVDTTEGGANLIYRTSSETTTETIALSLTAGKTYYFEVQAGIIESAMPGGNPGGYPDKMLPGVSEDSAERAPGGGGGNNGADTDKYISSYVDFTYSSISMDDYTPLAVTRFKYDGAGNLIKVKPPNYYNPPGSSDSTDWEISYTYNTLGRMTAKETPDDGHSQYKYDPNGNLRFSQDANLANNGEVQFTGYDFANRPLVSGVAAATFSTLSSNNSYTFESDSANWLQVNAYDEAPSASDFPWSHVPGVGVYLDSLQNTAARIAADAYKVGDGESQDYLALKNTAITGIRTFYGNDSISVGPSVTIESSADITFKAGSRIVLKDGFHAKAGSKFKAQIDAGLLSNPVTVDYWQVTLYSYDPAGMVVNKYIFTDGQDPLARRFSYNARGQLLESRDLVGADTLYHFYEYNRRGQLARAYVSPNDQKPTYCDVAYDYDDVGLLATQHYVQTGSSYQTSVPYQYHIRDWITEIGDVADSGEPFGAQYTYLPDGNISTAEFYNKQAGMQPRFKYDYTYDGMNRLLKADYSHYTTAWQSGAYFDVDTLTYDSNGNILSLKRRKDNQNLIDDLSYSYDDNNWLNSITDAVAASGEDWDAEDATFQYDANGNLKSMTENGSAKIDSIIYDVRNLPVRIYVHNGPTIIYRYNAAGQRIYKKVGTNDAECYIMDGDQNIAVFEADTLKYWNIFGSGLSGRREANSDKFYYLKDHLGSTRTVVNNSGSIVESHDYYPFGLQMPGRDYQTGERTKELFTGKERDSETNWDYFGARYYSAAIGRWLSVDPLAEKFPNWSPYNYTLNNPINLFDPDGKAPGGPGYYTASKSLKEGAFIVRHPQIAIAIGLDIQGSTNISTNAVRFSTRIGLRDNATHAGSQVNAFRHALWQATITEQYGESIAKQAGNAHETFPTVMERTDFPSIKSADQQADLRNNIIGREIGAQNPGASMQELAKKVLDYYKTNGLWVAVIQNGGAYVIQQVKLSAKQYDKALKILNKLNPDGYTDEEQKRKDEEN